MRADPLGPPRRLPSGTQQVAGRRLEYCWCRVLPDTALVLRDVIREAERLWIEHLGAEEYRRLRASPEGDDFFTARVRLEPVPPERQMLAVWLPFPPAFPARLKVQLVDYVEAFEPPAAGVGSGAALVRGDS